MARSRYSDEDDEDREDRPKKKKRRRDDDYDDREEGGNKGLLIGGLVGGGVLLLAVIVLVVVFAAQSKKSLPDEADNEEVANDRNAVNPVPNPKQNPFIPNNPSVPKIGSSPQAKAKDDEPVKRAPGTIVLAVKVQNVNQMASGGGPSGFTAVSSFRDRGLGMQFDVIQTATGIVQGQVITESIAEDVFSLSPDGKYLAVMGVEPFEGNPVNLYSVADGKLIKKHQPYYKKNDITIPDLIWTGFPSKDRLITVNHSGGFDLWSVPALERIAGIPGPLKFGARCDINLFTKTPVNFQMTPDGKSFAIFDGTGFTFYDPITMKQMARTPEFLRPNQNALFSGCGFSPDGSKFAVYVQTFGKGGAIELRLFDAKTGADAGGGPVNKIQAPAGFAWWGPNHLVFWEGGVSSAKVFDVANRQVVCTVRTSIPGKFQAIPSNGQLWASVADGKFDPFNGKTALVHLDAPNVFQLSVDWELSQTGLQPKATK